MNSKVQKSKNKKRPGKTSDGLWTTERLRTNDKGSKGSIRINPTRGLGKLVIWKKKVPTKKIGEKNDRESEIDSEADLLSINQSTQGALT